jgi:hypothetical protein
MAKVEPLGRRLSWRECATSAKARFLKDPLHGPEGPFFHHFFALKREEPRALAPGGRAALSGPRKDQKRDSFLAAAGPLAMEAERRNQAERDKTSNSHPRKDAKDPTLATRI